MEKNFVKLKIVTFLLVIAIIIICIMGVLLCRQDGSVEVSNQEMEITTLNKEDQFVVRLIDKIKFLGHGTASIYKSGEFNMATIPNDLVLRLGWGNNFDKERTETETEIKESITKEQMKESIQSIFGPELKYTDSSFVNHDVSIFEDYCGISGTVEYSDNKYIANVCEGGGATRPFIYQEVDKVEQRGETIKIYIKSAFVDIGYPEEQNSDFIYKFYKEYNFNTSEFENKLIEIEEQEFWKTIPVEGQPINSENSSALASVIEQLNTYVYTFDMAEDGNYYWSAFSKCQ